MAVLVRKMSHFPLFFVVEPFPLLVNDGGDCGRGQLHPLVSFLSTLFKFAVDIWHILHSLQYHLHVLCVLSCRAFQPPPPDPTL